MEMAKKVGKASAFSMVIVSLAFFIFMMFKVPLYGGYKLSAVTFTIFKRAFWILTGTLAFLDFLDFWRKPKVVTVRRRDRLRPRANPA